VKVEAHHGINQLGSSVVEVKGSHAVYVSQPKAVADLIEKAATSLSTK